MKTRRGWVRGYNVQAVVTPQQIILATEANDVQQLQPMLGKAQAMVELLLGEDALLGSAAADAGYWSEENAASQTEECELFIATRQDRKQRAELREAASPRGRMPKRLSARQRKLRTKRGCAIYAQRGTSAELVFSQMKDRQGAGQFSMRGIGACQGEWHLHAAVHNLRNLCRDSVRRRAAASQMTGRQTDPEGRQIRPEMPEERPLHATRDVGDVRNRPGDRIARQPLDNGRKWHEQNSCESRAVGIHVGKAAHCILDHLPHQFLDLAG